MLGAFFIQAVYISMIFTWQNWGWVFQSLRIIKLSDQKNKKINIEFDYKYPKFPYQLPSIL